LLPTRLRRFHSICRAAWFTHQTGSKHVSTQYNGYHVVLLLVHSIKENDAPECVEKYKTKGQESCKNTKIGVRKAVKI
jgi:pyruvate/2-oxoglutarate/acetoin dehydrogenase E1 component